MPTTGVARAWLEGRVAAAKDRVLRDLLRALVEELSLASGEAVTLRRLTADGLALVPLAAYHPDPRLTAAIASSAGQTTWLAESGLWRPVVEQLAPVRWHVPPGSVPPVAAAAQVRHLQQFPVRAVVGAPVLGPDGALLGGVALHRYVRDEPFADADEALLVSFAAQVADLVALVVVPTA